MTVNSNMNDLPNDGGTTSRAKTLYVSWGLPDVGATGPPFSPVQHMLVPQRQLLAPVWKAQTGTTAPVTLEISLSCVDTAESPPDWTVITRTPRSLSALNACVLLCGLVT